MDSWPRINTRRFDGESEGAFRRRAARIAEIITTFRFARDAADEGEQLEQELIQLQSPGYYMRREMMALN